MRLIGFLLSVFFLSLSSITVVFANDYPNKPIKIIDPYPPGGSTDIAARLVAESISNQLGQTVIVENKPGASGSIGTQYVAHQAADGYTFMIGTDPTHGTNKLLIPDQRFDPLEDFTPLGLLALNPILLVVNPAVEADTLEEYLALVDAGVIEGSFGSSGLGSPHHLAGELLSRYSGVSLVHIPYRGGVPATNDLLGNQIPAAFVSVITALPHLQSGKLKALAVTDKQRYEALSDVPTIGETFEGFSVPSWLAFFAPKDLSEPEGGLLIGAIQNAIHDPKIKQHLLESGLVVPEDTSPEALSALQQSDFEVKRQIIVESGLNAVEP